MASQKEFQLMVLSQEKVLYFGSCEALFVPGPKDTIAVMAHHTPLIMKLKNGSVWMMLAGERSTLSDIEKGILYVGNNEASVLINI